MAKRRDKKQKAAARRKTTRPAPATMSRRPRSDIWLPRPHAENKRIFYVVSNYTGTAWYRCHVPGTGLRNLGHTVILNHEISSQELEFNDIVVFQQSASETARQYIMRGNEIGKTTVFEIDDDYWSMTTDNPVYEEWHAGDGLRLLRECMGQSSVVTTTTPYLAKILSEHHPNVKVLPNMLPTEYWDVPRPDHGDTLVIGWAGGVSHWRDLQLLAGTIEQIVYDYPHVELWIAGMRQYPFKEHERIKILPSVKIEEYPKLLANFDIGLAPLVDNHFTRCKSDLKYLEYARVGAAVVASPVEPYMRTLVDGENGLFAAKTKDWMRQLRRLADDPDLRLSLAAAGKQVALSRTIDKNAHLWEEAYGIR